MSKIEVNTVEPQCGTTLTLGASGDTVTLGSGATAAGFGSTGEISWDTTPKTADFTGVSGVGYFVNTAGGAVTVTLPGSPSAGNVIGVSDYNSTAATNAITINRNSNKINGDTENLSLSKANSAIQLVYIDATTGWQSVFTGNTSDIAKTYMVATGGTITEDGNFKVHTFTGPGTFTVSSEAECSSDNVVDYQVVAGGGAGGSNPTGFNSGGGGGAGGMRFSATTYTSPSPLKAPAALPVSVQAYPITVGGGATGAASVSKSPNGSASTFSTITSAGGGSGGAQCSSSGASGGSGGGGLATVPSSGGPGNGNTPPVSPPQGNNGGSGSATTDKRQGGAGLAIAITGSCVARAGGGGGGSGPSASNGTAGTGGTGGGGAGQNNNVPIGTGNGANGTSGTVNTGGGGGGTSAGGTSGSGGSGVVIIRYRFQ